MSRSVLLAGLLAGAMVPGDGIAIGAAAKGREAVERWLASFPGTSAGELIALDDSSVRSALPSLELYVFRFRRYPVSQAIPEGLAPTNILAVRPGGTVELVPDAGALETVFRSAARRVTNRRTAEGAMKAWLRLTEEFQQDGFFHFARPEVVAFRSGARGIRVSGRTPVLPDAGDSGEIRAELSFDRSGRLTKVSETGEVVPGHRPI